MTARLLTLARYVSAPAVMASLVGCFADPLPYPPPDIDVPPHCEVQHPECLAYDLAHEQNHPQWSPCVLRYGCGEAPTCVTAVDCECLEAHGVSDGPAFCGQNDESPEP